MDVIDTTTDGLFRVRLVRDEDHGEPDHEGQGTVVSVHWGITSHGTVMRWHEVGDPFADDIREAINDWANTWSQQRGDLATWLANALPEVDVASIATHTVRDGSLWVNVVTEADCTAWGIPEGAPIRKEAASLEPWEQWLEGDIWGYVIERQVTWVSLDSDGDPVTGNSAPTMSTWEEIEDVSLWGLFGREYAEHEAREALASAVR